MPASSRYPHIGNADKTPINGLGVSIVNIKLIVLMCAAAYVIFVLNTESINPFDIPTRHKRKLGYHRRRSRYRLGLSLSFLIALSPVSLVIYPVSGLFSQVLFSLLFASPFLLGLLYLYGLNFLIRAAPKKRELSTIASDTDRVSDGERTTFNARISRKLARGRYSDELSHSDIIIDADANVKTDLNTDKVSKLRIEEEVE